MKSRPRIHPPEARRRFGAWRAAAQIAAIVLAVVIVYLPALHGDFVWDDELLVTKNPLLRSFSGLLEIWSGGRIADYFPITNTVFWIEWHLFGQAATGYHVVNILLHSANALLLWLALHRLKIPGAWLAGLIFAIHPVHAESVAWISELKNVLSMFFALISTLCFLEVREKRWREKSIAYVGSIVFFILALLSKTQVVFLPVAFLLLTIWQRRRSQPNAQTTGFRRDLIRTIPFFFISILLGLVTVWFQNRGIGDEQMVFGSFLRRLANAGIAAWWYAARVFAPVRLMPIYAKWRFDSPSWFEWLPLLGLVGGLAVLWTSPRRAMHSLFFALAYFVIALLPVLGFFQMSYVRSGTLVADHYQYFADVSLIALVSASLALLWARWSRGRVVMGAFIVLIVSALGTYTWSRAETYYDEETLWRDNLSKNPDAWQAYNRLGQRYFDQGRHVEAAENFRRAVELKPELADNHNQLGLAYCRLERFDEGIAQYREALRLKERSFTPAQSASMATVRTNLANALTVTGNRISESAPTLPGQAMQRYAEAIREYEKALELQPGHPAIHRNLGILLARLGKYPEAIRQLRAALEIAPTDSLARETLDAIESQVRE
ncbi:MAG: protein O-mannosyl-transferase [Verrucomicrobiota bacterium]